MCKKFEIRTQCPPCNRRYKSKVKIKLKRYVESEHSKATF